MWQSASTADLADRWATRGVRLRNNFGSTAFATWIITQREGDECAPASLGRPVRGYTLGVVDADSGTVESPGGRGPGQLAVKGPTGLTYWRRPELQARDVRDGWTVVDDLIELDDEGFVAYRGRTDFIISTAGYKVAPLEIEEVLSTHPAVREVGVVGLPDDERGEVVAAFVAVHDGVSATHVLAAELQDHVKALLAPYKYPRRVTFVDGLPRDHVGKVQPNVLRAWAGGRTDDGGG
jgi:2-aminobenzoate-CoA ligase